MKTPFGAICLLACLALQAGAALAHAVVKQSAPAQGAVLAAAPSEVAITFNEKVEKLFSSAALRDAAGATIDTGKARIDPENPAMLRLAVPALKPGKYTVHWTAVGQDGHRLSGQIHFSVR